MDKPRDLNSTTYKNTKKFSMAGLSTAAKCVKVYDGDTAQFVIDFTGFYRFSCRMMGYNSAEITSTDPAEKCIAVKARDALSQKILDKIVRLQIGEHDKYGRLLVDVFLGDEHINGWMMDNGHGKPYNGSGKKNW